MLRYTDYGIVFQEVPDEVSLYFNISNCQIKCPGCHSKHLWSDIGDDLNKDLVGILLSYLPYITCVCFMGGTHDMASLRKAVDVAKTLGLKICLYTGEENSDKFNDILKVLNYVKFGPYIDEFGGLDKKTTNQRFYKICEGKLIDKTHLFQEEKI